MKQPTLMLRSGYAIIGLIALGLVYAAFRVLSNDPIRLSVVSFSAILPGHSTFGLTNTTSRHILYRVSWPQFKCDGVWTEFCPPTDAVWTGSGKPLVSLPPEVVAAQASSTLAVARPMHITASEGATTWRVGVVWGYAYPTRFQQLKSQAVGFITGGTTLANRVVYTNYTAEVSL